MITTTILNIEDTKYNPFTLEANRLYYQKNNVFFTNDINANKKTDHNFYTAFTFIPNTHVNDIFYEIDADTFFNYEHRLEIKDDRVKVLLPSMHHGFGHYIIDTFGLIVESIKYLKNPLIVININSYVTEYWGSGANQDALKYILFLKNYLKKLNIDYVFLKNNYYVSMNNFYVVPWLNHSDSGYNNIYKECFNLAEVSKKIPEKKVYIKSKWFSQHGADIDINTASIQEIALRRVSNEKYLEDYLIDNGFLIISPEKDFDSIENQIRYFNDVKTIFSITGSGLVNSLFMQSGGNVIDLVSPLSSNLDQTFFELHSSQYQNMSYARGHNYFGRKNLVDGKLIVEDIKNNPKFLEMIK